MVVNSHPLYRLSYRGVYSVERRFIAKTLAVGNAAPDRVLLIEVAERLELLADTGRQLAVVRRIV
jgi:hypothetical protein